MLRGWRGDAHLVVLADNRLGPCDCNVLHAATGRRPPPIVRATRQWDDGGWSAATERLVTRGWLETDGTATDAGTAARERIEVETDEHCAGLWEPIGATGARPAELLRPIDEAFTAVGTYAQPS